MQKYQNSEIRPFTFSEISSPSDLKSAKFETFSFKTIDGEIFNSQQVSEETMRQEREFASRNNFKIDDLVSSARGLSSQEKNDLEDKINLEVQKRLETAYQEAYQEGLLKGKEEARIESLKEFKQLADHSIEDLENIIQQVQQQSNLILTNNYKEIYEFTKRFTKWIVLKEINEKTYLENLLEKLILEINARRNLIIKVGKSSFSQMPEVLASVEARIGQLSNTRIEIVPEIDRPGIILESENGFIDGSIEGIFQNIDKIFEQVGKGE